SEILSPESPATIRRIPNSPDLLLLWNDHCQRSESFRRAHPPVRNPLVAALSHDGGKTWVNERTIENASDRGFCYSAVAFAGDRVLLAYCAGKSPYGLDTLCISSFHLRDLRKSAN
ncbi:MAG TPA: sialidase family protein, partial [Verrucomicrobiae bacterium]|nr:sialidase family protein [Verrucomicrobiae bacterium]